MELTSQHFTLFFKRRYFLLLSILLLRVTSYSQTTWSGSLGTDWNDPSNWSAGIPDVADDVSIPNVANKPVLGTSAAAKSITIAAGSSLTLTIAGTLILNGTPIGGSSYSIQNNGTLTNGGIIRIGNTADAGFYGIQNYGTLLNQGTIYIDRAAFGLRSYQTVINEAIIDIGGTGNLNYDGVYLTGNTGLLHNKPGALIKIDRVTALNLGGQGIFTSSNVTINNQGTITIGAAVKGGDNGIQCSGTFNNQTGSIINIDRISNSGINNEYGTFNNQGTVNIGSVSPVTELTVGSFGTGNLNNNAGGIIKGTGNLSTKVHNLAGTLAPGYSPGKMTFTGDESFGAGILAIEVNGPGTGGTNFDQLVVNGKATLNGTLALSINYAGANGHNIPILIANEVIGTFTTVTWLAANWYVSYNVTGVSLVYCSTSFLFPAVTGGGLYSCGGAGLPIGLASSQIGVTYQLKKDGVNNGVPVAGTGSAISFGNKTKGTYTVVATVTVGGCTATLPGQAVVIENCLHAALNFDGTNDFVSLPNGLATAMTADTALTIEFWFKGTAITSAVRVQVGGAYVIAGFSNGKHIISTDGGSAGVSIGANATNGNWHHLAMTWQKNTVNGFKSYLDGVLVEQRNSANANLPALASGLTLGSNGGTAEFMTGSLDELRIWKVARTQCEIQSSWNCELGPIGRTGLLAQYKFNQGIVGENNSSVNTLADSSGNNYNGTLTNFALTGVTSTWISPGGVTIGNTCTGTSTWLGTTNNWNTASNWSTGRVPEECTRVIINTGVPFSPTVTGTTNACYSVTLNNLAVINIGAGAKLNITGK